MAWTLNPPMVYMTCATGSHRHKIEACADREGVRHCKMVPPNPQLNGAALGGGYLQVCAALGPGHAHEGGPL